MPSFLSPLFLIGCAAAAVPVVLHLLRREPEPRVKFAAVRLLRGAPIEYTDRRRLRELVLLVLRVLALVLLAIGFARPFLPSSAAEASAGATVVVLDTSYSMSAPGVFPRAKTLAKEAVRAAGSGSLVGVVTFADLALVASPLQVDRAFALSAIDGAAAGFGTTRYRTALSAAVQALGGRPGTIVLVTDLQESGWDAGDRASVPEAVRVEIADVGIARVNLAVTAIREVGGRLVASVRNSGDEERRTRVKLALDGRQAGDVAVDVAPHAASDVAFGPPSGATTATVSVDDAGGIEADNVRYAMVGSGTRPRLRVVTSNGDIGRDAFYVQQALAAGAPGVMKYDVSAAAPAQLGSEEPNRLSAYAAVVLLSTRGLERRGREALSSYVRGGGGLLMAAGPEVDGGVVADVLGRDQRLRITAEDAKATERSLVPVEVSHPVFQPFGSTLSRLGLVTFRRVAHVEGGPCRAIARFTTGEAAMLDCGAGEGHAIVLASDLDNRWNDFPLRAAFVPFVHETLRYVTDGRSPDAAMLVADVPAGVPPAPGFATVREGRGAANETRRVAVNVDPRESDLTRMSAHEFQGAVARLKSVAAADSRADARRQEDRQHLWMWALGLMIAVLVLESLVASRTA